jgi:regulator of replication initiation timing
MTPAEMIGTVRRLIDEVMSLRVENEKLSPAMAGQRVESQALKDESCAAEP